MSTACTGFEERWKTNRSSTKTGIRLQGWIQREGESRQRGPRSGEQGAGKIQECISFREWGGSRGRGCGEGEGQWGTDPWKRWPGTRFGPGVLNPCRAASNFSRCPWFCAAKFLFARNIVQIGIGPANGGRILPAITARSWFFAASALRNCENNWATRKRVTHTPIIHLIFKPGQKIDDGIAAVFFGVGAAVLVSS